MLRPKARRGAGAALPELDQVRVADLAPARRNARTHSKKQIRQIADSIQEFGFINPVIVDGNRRVVAGHGRLEAARLLGMVEVPVISVAHLSEAAVRAYALADNRLAEKAGWNRELLAIELQELTLLLPEIELDLSVTGFEPAEIDTLLIDLSDEKQDPADEVPPAQATVVARPGDLFCLGQHRLLVGDARRPDSYERLMRGERARMAVLDPPYNVRIQGHVGGRGRTKHREFVCASGEMSRDQFTAFLTEGLGLCADHSADGAIHFVFMDWRHMGELLGAGESVYSELKNLCVWTKNNAGQGSFYRSQHELVFVFKHGTAPHVNTFELGQYGRNRSNVWPYAGVNSFRAGRLDELKLHPTVKPVSMIADAMRDCSRRGDVVLDAFAGSGTTIMAAEQIGRRAYCLELDPGYADVCIRRWQAYTKRDAILEGTGHTFEELSAVRAPDSTSVRKATVALSNRGERENEQPDGLPSKTLKAGRRP